MLGLPGTRLETEVPHAEELHRSTQVRLSEDYDVTVEAYLEQFPNGMFRALAENRLSALRGPAGGSPAAAGVGPGRVGTPASESRASGTRAPAAGIAAAGDTRPRPGAEFRSDETCAGQLAGTACWKEVFGQPGCYVWDSSLVLGQTVTWTGECTGGLAQGTGTLTWASDGNQQTSTGRLQDGQGTGNWVIRLENGDVYEGPYVDGERNGHWVLRWASGTLGLRHDPAGDVRPRRRRPSAASTPLASGTTTGCSAGATVER